MAGISNKTIKTPTVFREALMRLFDNEALKRLIYVYAPAGYGKTFSIHLWLLKKNAKKAWVVLDSASGSKARDFCERFAVSLCALQPENQILKEHVAHHSFSAAPFEFLGRTLNLFRLYADPNLSYILVIDDCHLITNQEIIRRLPDFLLALPENVTLCILSRSLPPDSLAGFFAKYMIEVIDAEALKFSAKEIQAYFASGGQTLTKKEALNIMDQTGGWAVGLNALMLSGKAQTERKLASRYLDAFIREELWQNWDEKKRDFLLRVSIEDDLTPLFCNAVTARNDSSVILAELLRENAFISLYDDGIYRFHHLFRDFLRNMLSAKSGKFKNEIYKKAGEFFYSHECYYKAVEYYLKCNDKNGIVKGLRLMYSCNSPYASIEETLSIINLSVNGAMVNEYQFLLEVLAWAAFVDGRFSEMEEIIDRYFKQLPLILLKHPASAATSYLLRFMDYRNSVVGLTKKLKKLPLSLFGQLNTPSLTNNMPLFHRAGRDLSELVFDMENNLFAIKETVGTLIGDEYELVDLLIRAGLFYEQGNLNLAHEYVLNANTKLKDDFPPEIQFCFYMLLALVSNTLNHHADQEKALKQAEKMIDLRKAYYLSANLHAFNCRLQMEDGDVDAAYNWLKDYDDSPANHLPFYKLYQHLTTVRARLVIGDFNTAIILLKKLKVMCEHCRRPLDEIEINILLAIAYWKKARSVPSDALIPLTEAISLANIYGFKQIFADEGVDITNMLHKLTKQVIQKDYDGELNAKEVKELYYLALARAKHSRGLFGGRASEKLKFTDQQKRIMSYLNEGLTQKEIAAAIGLKPSTIKSHMILIYKKLDVSNLMDAIIKIRELHLFED
ncbi:MAG: LuxR C-terminal-related transcriptional regulator [Lachnospiraceae bacterium]|nr:LuxR C-terminal-related transcriptional regulator [Lachnospiraceae bacterium]